MYNIIYYDMHAERIFATHIIILLMLRKQADNYGVYVMMIRLYASQFIEQLKVLESQYDELFNCVYYDHYENFMESLRNKECDKADIYFLDIEFGEVYGMDVAKIITRMNRNAGIVYITNYEEYAIKAFVCRPLGFIRKKHDAEDIKVTMD